MRPSVVIAFLVLAAVSVAAAVAVVFIVLPGGGREDTTPAGTTAKQAPTREKFDALLEDLNELPAKIDPKSEITRLEVTKKGKEKEWDEAKKRTPSLTGKIKSLEEGLRDLSRLEDSLATVVIAAVAGLALGGLLSGLLFLRVVWREKITGL